MLGGIRRLFGGQTHHCDGDVGRGVVAAAAGEGVAVVMARLVAFAGFSGQEAGTEIVGGDEDAIWRSHIVN